MQSRRHCGERSLAYLDTHQFGLRGPDPSSSVLFTWSPGMVYVMMLQPLHESMDSPFGKIVNK